jgi:hypothetical protein
MPVALVLMALHTVRSERLFCQQKHDLLKVDRQTEQITDPTRRI